VELIISIAIVMNHYQHQKKLLRCILLQTSHEYITKYHIHIAFDNSQLYLNCELHYNYNHGFMIKIKINMKLLYTHIRIDICMKLSLYLLLVLLIFSYSSTNY